LRVKNGESYDIFENITNVNSVKEDGDTRDLYTFDGFMNHSCDFNTISSFTKIYDNTVFYYDQIASMDIDIGDELTCNYLHFDYECEGHEFECCCNSKNCVKYVNGFKNLDFETKVKLLPYLDSNILELFKKEYPNVIFKHVNHNENVEIFEENSKMGGLSLKSLKKFKEGDVVFKNSIEKVPHDKQIILKYKTNKYIALVQETHFSQDEDALHFYNFDSFTNHSCNPNCHHLRINEYDYEMIAKKDINIGDEITCDYSLFETEYDEYSFICHCGEKYCRGVVI
jgi:SET domain-containing protein